MYIQSRVKIQIAVHLFVHIQYVHLYCIGRLIKPCAFTVLWVMVICSIDLLKGLMLYVGLHDFPFSSFLYGSLTKMNHGFTTNKTKNTRLS